MRATTILVTFSALLLQGAAAAPRAYERGLVMRQGD